MIIKLNLSQNVSILEHSNELREIMSISDLVVSCSTEPEAFGRVSLEALIRRPRYRLLAQRRSRTTQSLFPYGK